MASYTVRPGDTLSGIAARTLGSSSKWRLLAELNNLTNPGALRVGQVLQIPDNPATTPSVVNREGETRPAAVEDVRIVTEGNTVFAVRERDGRWIRVGKRFRKGLYRNGQEEPEHFIRSANGLLESLQLTPSEIKVMLATAENEGNLDAVNTWDNQYLSFGMFQWTAGGDDQPGELAALLAGIKRQAPDDFDHYFGRFGLDVVDVGARTGWITLDGHTLRSDEQKNSLREPVWAYRFAQAGADEHVKAAQIAHAVGRLGTFYFTRTRKLAGFSLAELVTSEFGVALLLDNHVNRPGYVHECVASAIADCGMQPADLAQGNDNDERQVLNAYLQIRQSFGRTPMTDAAQRAEVTRRYLTDGMITDTRRSFVSSENH